MSVVIAEYFEQKQKTLQDTSAAAEKKLSQLKDETDGLSKSVNSRKSELKRMAARKGQAESDGLDTAPLKAKMDAIQQEIDALSLRIQNNANAMNGQSSDEQSSGYESHLRASAVLKELGCTTAEVVTALGDCARVIRVNLNDIECDDMGHPTECRVHFDSHTSLVVPICGGERHYTTSFWPKSLGWLPSLSTATQADEEPPTETPNGTKSADKRAVTAFVQADSDRLIVSFDPDQLWEGVAEEENDHAWSELQRTSKPVEPTPKREGITAFGSSWEDKEYSRQLSDYHDKATKYAKVKTRAYHAAISHAADSLPQSIVRSLATDGDRLDLGRDPTDPLLKHLRSEVLKHLTTSPKYRPTSEVKVSTEVYSAIRTDWDRFITAPWGGNITGLLALLKYHVENGERPRFWCREFENYFGFRLRTRDHSWIYGAIYIEPDESRDCLPTITIHRHNYHASVRIATIGRMHLLVESD